MWSKSQWEFLPGTSLAHNFTTHVLLRNYHLFLKPLKMKDLQPFKNISTSFIQTSFILLCPKWRYTVEELADGQKRSIMHNFIAALATQAHPQKPQGCPFAYINIADGCVHCRSLPCFHGKSQMNYLVAKENTSTFLYFSSYMTLFFLFLGAPIFHFFTVIPSTHNPVSKSISQPFNFWSLFNASLLLQPWATWKSHSCTNHSLISPLPTRAKVCNRPGSIFLPHSAG